MNPLHEQFVSEARELIAQASDDLIDMERKGTTAARLDQAQRGFHTLKGSAGLVDLPAMILTMHAAEDLVAGIQDGRLVATTPVISQLLECLDLISRWVDAFGAQGELPARAGEDARAMAEQLRAHLAPAGGPAGATSGALPAWAARLLAVRRADIARRLGARRPQLVALSYEPHAGCFFDGDDPVQLLRQLPNLLALQCENAAFGQPLSDLDPFACSLRFFAIAEGSRDDVATVFRSVPDQVRIIALSADALGPSAEPGAGLSRIVRSVVTEQREMLRASTHPEGLSGRIEAAARSAANALRHENSDAFAQDIASGAAAASTLDPAPLLAVLDRVVAALEPPATDQHGNAATPEAASSRPADEATGRFLRVPEARVDALVNLAGELIVLKNRFSHLAARMEAEGASDISRTLKREQELIDRLAGDFHDAILQLRMVPIGQLLRPFPRLVRDLSQQLGKTVQFVARGEATEFDKAVVDRLYEPLLHVVRNALDHGIETPQARTASGKAETGTLSIEAVRLGDRIALDISDDGRGIDLDAVRRKAAASGMMDSDALAALSDEEALELIFASGFSTAGEISDVSGRGVGMDVVRTAIDRIGGKVSVTSQPGAGTTVRIDVPVSIATAHIMVVECAGQRFGIAMDAVSETVRLRQDRISRVKTNEGFVLRDRVVPICSLAEIMDLPQAAKPDAATRLLVIVEAGAKVVAVEIDAIRDRLDAVLKPMQGLLSSARGYAGTTILGDGTVLLVLDLKEILP